MGRGDAGVSCDCPYNLASFLSTTTDDEWNQEKGNKVMTNNHTILHGNRSRVLMSCSKKDMPHHPKTKKGWMR
jgi:hypothetical protein